MCIFLAAEAGSVYTYVTGSAKTDHLVKYVH